MAPGRVGNADVKAGLALTLIQGAVAEAGSTNRTPHLRPRKGGGSRASGGRQRGCGHYPRGSRQRRDRCLIGASALLGICTKRLEGTSAAPTWQSGLALAPYRVRPPRGCCTLLNKRACPAFLRPLAGRPKGGCQRGERPLARFCILLARSKRMASRGGATPPRDAPGGNAEATALPVAGRPGAN